MESRADWIRSQCSGTILDVGSADGWIFKGSGLDVTCLDINQFASGEFPRVVGDAHNLPFADESFDITCLCEILEHVHNPILALREAARVAKKKVVFTVPDEEHWTPDHMPRKTLDDWIREKKQTPEQIFKEGNPSNIELNDLKQSFHNRWYTKETLESQLKYLSLPYQIQTLAYDGWSWFCGEILKEGVTKAPEIEAFTFPKTTLDSPMPETATIKYQAEVQPRSLHIDTFPFCNAKCSWCRYHTLTRARNKMEMKLLEHILDDAASWTEPLKAIVPIHYGELFLDPDWYDTLKLIETKLPRTGIVVPTNGSMMNQVTVEKLATIRTLSIVSFSVNAFFRETYRQLMGLDPENIPRIKQAINQLKILRPKVRIWVSMVHSALYQTELERSLFTEEWRHYTPGTNITTASYCHDYFKPLFKTNVPCRSIFADFVILSDGRVCPCCWDSDGSTIVGDVTREKILDIWHGEAMNNLRELHNSGRRNEVPICSECTFS